jgi:hypothetical protein
MTPLQRIAMGLVIVVLDTRTPWDLLPDVLGWLLVLAGIAVLPVPDRGTLRTSAVVAALVSVIVYPPQVHEPLAAADPSLRWVADLPDLAFAFLLARSLGRVAAEAGDRRTAGRMRVLLTVVTVLAIAPVLVFAAGAEHLLLAATVLVQVMWIWLVWNLFAAHARPYATEGTGTGS